ncbi:hypothetical protein PHMEG_00020359 [Phytophthora megakarya]|uniref:Uncharacterized protein n=1 Tax=Phytophthora megakarya TaxID=4795 RepID=A0A225VP40_9STRA|nr:hypothetical protein PHMEG_00020359 [Phytophthora megakarya]
MYTLIRLKVDRGGNIASSKAMIAGGMYPAVNRSCSASIIGRSFHALSVLARTSSLRLKCRFRDRCMKRCRAMNRPKHPRGMAPSSVVHQWCANFSLFGAINLAIKTPKIHTALVAQCPEFFCNSFRSSSLVFALNPVFFRSRVTYFAYRPFTLSSIFSLKYTFVSSAIESHRSGCMK